MSRDLLPIPAPFLVIPAKAGIHSSAPRLAGTVLSGRSMDPRFRGDDERGDGDDERVKEAGGSGA
jgi:hypothetical protein